MTRAMTHPLAPKNSHTTPPPSRPLPATMRAAAIDHFGPPNVLTTHTLPVPIPTTRQVLIELHSAGVGIWDAEIRKGDYAEGNERFPLVLGTDGAGIVVAHGSDAGRFPIGTPVWAYEFGGPKGGFYAEYVAVSASHVSHAPKELSLLEAGAGAVTSLTAQQGIDKHIKLRNGETILIFGAAGAVGTLAVQFARRTGAHVIATASSGEQTLRELGAEHVIDARAPDAVATLKSFAPNGLNAILALAGGAVLEKCAALLVKGGRLAYPHGVSPKPRKRAKVRNIAYDAKAGSREFEKLNRAVTEANLKVVIAKTHSLDQAAQAHEEIEQGHVVGRIALQIR